MGDNSRVEFNAEKLGKKWVKLDDSIESVLDTFDELMIDECPKKLKKPMTALRKHVSEFAKFINF